MSIKIYTITDACIMAVYRIIASFFKTKPILKLLAIIFIVSFVVRFIEWIPTVQIKQSTVPQRAQPVTAPSLGEIPREAGITLVASNGGKSLYANPANGNISVIDDESGIVWNSFRQEHDSSPENMSFLRIAYLSKDNINTNWFSYNFSQRDGNFYFENIPNGVRLTARIGNYADPVNINIFMPRRIAVDRFERVFIRGLDDKAAQGIITREEVDNFISTLRLIYLLDDSGEFYFNKLRFLPPISATRQMLAMVRLLGYTTENLIEDEAPYDLPVIDRRPPVGFTIPIDYVLDNGDLVVSVATENIGVLSDYYTLTRLYIMPNFGSVSAQESPGGYLFVPDGSGALFALNSFDPNYNGYERPLYWNTIYRELHTMHQLPEDLKMPVFGMMYERGGFFAIIEEGDETAFIGARAASVSPGTAGDMYNSVYNVFDVTRFGQVDISGESRNFGTYTVSTGMMDIDIVIRYKLFGEPVTYFDMASFYRNYLIEKYNLKPDYSKLPQVFLEVTGALTIEGRFLGNAYERIISMTRYPQMMEILEDLHDIRTTISYTGVFNDGIDNKLTNRAVLIRQNGRPAELDMLLETAHTMGKDIFMGTNLARVYKRRGNGFSPRIHASFGFEGEPAVFRAYNPATRQVQRFMGSRYYVLNPVFLPNCLDGFMQGARRFDNIYVNDLGNDYLANYRRNSFVTPMTARIIVDESLTQLGKEKKLALNNPSMNTLPFADWFVNISRESSGYGGFYTSIPFRQLVMNGLINYTTLDVNNSGGNMDYFLLQALELGSVPKFTITAQNADVLKYTTHTGFLSTQYDTHKDSIREIYNRWNEVFWIIGCGEIINHETLADRVYRTTYRSGVTVTVNYRRFTVQTEDGPVPPRSFIIKEPNE